MGRSDYTEEDVEFDFIMDDWGDLDPEEAAYLAALSRLDMAAHEGQVPIVREAAFDSDTGHYAARVIWRDGKADEVEWFQALRRDFRDLQAESDEDESESDSG